MSHNTRVFKCPPDAVFAVLADGWTYASWVVGAARIRDVDDDWPAVGSRVHHSVGAWPLMISDTTTVEAVTAPSELVLTVRAWPAGQGKVRISVVPEGAWSRVTMEEDAEAGPAIAMIKPVRDLVLKWRNAEALRRLAYLAERRARGEQDEVDQAAESPVSVGADQQPGQR